MVPPWLKKNAAKVSSWMPLWMEKLPCTVMQCTTKCDEAPFRKRNSMIYRLPYLYMPEKRNCDTINASRPLGTGAPPHAVGAFSVFFIYPCPSHSLSSSVCFWGVNAGQIVRLCWDVSLNLLCPGTMKVYRQMWSGKNLLNNLKLSLFFCVLFKWLYFLSCSLGIRIMLLQSQPLQTFAESSGK